MKHLSKTQAAVLALWSFSMVLTRSSSISAATVMLSALLGQKENTVRQRLREWYWDAADKKGAPQRREVKVENSFVPLLSWILSKWQGQQLALAIDATLLGDRLVVLAVSVLYRGCAIPVAWTVLAANKKHPWRKEWLRMLRLLHRAVPEQMCVIVLSDRGISRPWLFRRICRLGWHPLLRITLCGTFRPDGQATFKPLGSFVNQVGQAWQGTGTLYRSNPLQCTLLSRWEAGYEQAWLLITDLPPQASQACGYGLRAWIEHGFKFIKSADWTWHRTRMTDPQRATRLWLVVALATLWLLSVGGYAEQTILLATVPDLADFPSPTVSRQVSIFRRGWAIILAALITHSPLPTSRFIPEPWPQDPVLIDSSFFLVHHFVT
jgi:hypothetical protein